MARQFKVVNRKFNPRRNADEISLFHPDNSSFGVDEIQTFDVGVDPGWEVGSRLIQINDQISLGLRECYLNYFIGFYGPRETWSPPVEATYQHFLSLFPVENPPVRFFVTDAVTQIRSQTFKIAPQEGETCLQALYAETMFHIPRERMYLVEGGWPNTLRPFVFWNLAEMKDPTTWETLNTDTAWVRVGMLSSQCTTDDYMGDGLSFYDAVQNQQKETYPAIAMTQAETYQLLIDGPEAGNILSLSLAEVAYAYPAYIRKDLSR